MLWVNACRNLYKVEKLLNAGGARKDLYMSEILTHCIADEDDDEVTEAKELFQLSVVKVMICVVKVMKIILSRYLLLRHWKFIVFQISVTNGNYCFPDICD